jgi:hypothetical protein
MNWREYWKQSNPFDQFMCVLMSVDGNVQNIKDGIGGDKPIGRLERHVEELRTLEQYLRRGSWEEPMLLQSCEAEVVHVYNHEVVVVMSIGGDLVEQVYDSSQFTEIPKKGDAFEVRVQFTKIQPRERPEPEYESRKNVVPLPRIF